MKTIAILGRPNVGKSSLFNRLCKENVAITSEISGTTRDIKKGVCIINGYECSLLDSGGIDKSYNPELSKKSSLQDNRKYSELFKQVSQASIDAGLNADLVLYVVDGRSCIDDEDKRVVRILQKQVPVWLVLNKIDNDKLKEQAWSFSTLGIKDMFFISVSHNRGLSILQNHIAKVFDLVAQTPRDSQEQQSIEEFLESQEQENIQIGIIGRVNVGKSSLLNALLGKNRSIVSDVAGTTIDPVDDYTKFHDYRLCFVDTAGIRRAGKIEGIEKYALDRTNKALERSHIALLVLDASQNFVELDEKISALIPKHNLAVIIVLNKWDIACMDFKSMRQELQRKFRFLEFAPIVCVSAKNKRNINSLKEMILTVWQNYNYRIPTAKLNEIMAQAGMRHHLPSDRGKIVKIYYATQFATCPPQISLVMNRPKALHFSYKRYLINCLREEFGFKGVPIILNPTDKKTNF
ncbi:MAG: ribosome biogenesis GTPase Der [Helicobacter sp.]|uniref:ribosome biogenesis GTPase Der n=1 Tax=Helicobacter sp. 10-6591 TaxID=2004998 RepID=UPI000DCE36A4|nr:ribosome biogenesis GTPase Der [Helicobacter sp. 10-6591]MCI6217275.1 ribosome biogenesis GTPase Der [Helicobacter sp.]MCI7484544.1 ribosome biogenesis GTPase Der [Helicobacter sp.]MDD7567223.1 ribosome biogenesis GTPase Der [Helicobacter sp.]MDY5741220.1 ribosome biogenesis GTPase Der [Helicobacter sp.]RAX54777.1 ribosome biogenesis GTPase Der [Helicobacter sp. 10-6591]